MRQTHQGCSSFVALLLAVMLAFPMTGTAQLGGILPDPGAVLPSPTSSPTDAVMGSATVVQANVLGVITTLASTGTLSPTDEAREASLAVASVGEALSASTFGWSDQVSSQASVASLSFSVAGIPISADFVMARATDVSGAAGSGISNIYNLNINGMWIDVTGAPNQTVWIPGGEVVINEQQVSASGITVNALHVLATGVADVVIASATAGIP